TPAPARAARAAAARGPAPARPPGGPRSRAAGRSARRPRSAGRPRPPATTGRATGPARPPATPGSWQTLPFPDAADPLQPAPDRARHAPQPRGDLLGGVVLHLEQRDGPEVGVPQAVEQGPALLGHLGGELGGRLPGQDLVESRLPSGRTRKGRLV